MKFKLYLSEDPEMLDAEEYHLDGFPTISDFFALDNRILRRVSFVSLMDTLPIVKYSMTDPITDQIRDAYYVKWKMEEDKLLDVGKPVWFAVRSI